MLISQQDAQRIANEMKGVLHRNINVIDENGKVHRKTRSKAGFKTKKEAIEYIPCIIK